MSEQLSRLNEEQLKIITAIGGEQTHIDDVIERTGLSPAKVLSQLTVLEIKGYIRRIPGRRSEPEYGNEMRINNGKSKGSGHSRVTGKGQDH